MHLGRLGAICGLVLFAAGCGIAPLRPAAEDPEQVWNKRVQSMKEVDQWELRGRLAVKTSKRGETVNMHWVREGADQRISLYGPLGSGGVILTLDEDGAMLRNDKGETFHDDSAEALLSRVAGWRVPFRDLQHWVLGVAAPGDGFEKDLDRWGRLTELTQNGWNIEVTEYHYYDGRDMPRKLVMNALPGTEHIIDDQADESETIQVKAYIRSWDWSRN